MGQSALHMRKGKRGKMVTKEGSHICESKSPPGSPSMNETMQPNSGVKLKSEKQSGQNRDRGSFGSGSQW